MIMTVIVIVFVVIVIAVTIISKIIGVIVLFASRNHLGAVIYLTPKFSPDRLHAFSFCTSRRTTWINIIIK